MKQGRILLTAICISIVGIFILLDMLNVFNLTM
jgi:hypothetical protein